MIDVQKSICCQDCSKKNSSEIVLLDNSNNSIFAIDFETPRKELALTMYRLMAFLQ